VFVFLPRSKFCIRLHMHACVRRPCNNAWQYWCHHRMSACLISRCVVWAVGAISGPAALFLFDRCCRRAWDSSTATVHVLTVSVSAILEHRSTSIWPGLSKRNSSTSTVGRPAAEYYVCTSIDMHGACSAAPWSLRGILDQQTIHENSAADTKPDRRPDCHS
jgi:hypothetical protein